jgi:multiple sugar transport system substrate-binding protein
VALAATAALCASLAAACGTGGSGDHVIKVAYPFWGTDDVLNRQMHQDKADYERLHPGRTVELLPIPDNQGNFATKIELMQRSPSSAPDVVWQDSLMTNADVAAGYLRPLDDLLAGWEDWKQFDTTARTATTANDGHVYGVLTGTEVRAIFYDKHIFDVAGLPAQWQPRTWADIFDAARTIKARVPDVTPVNLYSSKSQGESTTTQGLLMLLYGTGDPLYHEQNDTWSGNTQGLRDSLEFVATLREEGLGMPVEQALDTRLTSRIASEYLPAGEVGIAMGEGSWAPKEWIPGGGSPWPEWTSTIGIAAMPTQYGQPPGRVTVSGGWMYAISSHSDNPRESFDFITLATSRENALEFAIGNAQIPVREDVKRDPEYLEALPTNRFFTDLLRYTRFRPALSEYLRVSNQMQVAMENVMTGSASAQEAAADYAEAIAADIGAEKVR